MSNILIRGCPGTGKTILARSAAYYICEKNLNEKDAFDKNPVDALEDIEHFFDQGQRCEFIQVHPSMEFDDIVYGLEIKAGDGLNISYAEKRIMALCNRARGKAEKYCVILDDINRANTSNLLGNLLYAMEYRNQDIELPDGSRMNIPDNVVLIFTENTLDTKNGLDFTVRRRMTYLRELKSSREAICNYYQGHISSHATDLILGIYDRVQDFIVGHFKAESGLIPSRYVPGHGMYMVICEGNDYFILDSVRQKIRFQIAPYLRDLYAMGLINADPDAFIEGVHSGLNTGIEGLCPISSIKKKLVIQDKFVTEFSLSDSRTYYHDEIVPKPSEDLRGIMECVLDAMILNGVFPHDVLMGALLQNTNIAYVETLRPPIEKAAYIIEINRAAPFRYLANGTEHAYFPLEKAKTGRYKDEDTEKYVVSYNNGTKDAEFIPLAGFRNHGFTPQSPKLAVEHNAAKIMTAVHILVDKYLELYKSNIALVKGADTEYQELYEFIDLEQQYLDAVKKMLKGRSQTSPKGDSDRLAYYVNKIKNLRLLWYEVGDEVDTDENKYRALTSGAAAVTIESYEDLFNYTSVTKKTIKIKGVVKMVDLKDYQKIMENINIRQMIFQGPPGTSKTFESMKFVLAQLKPGAPAANASEISQALEEYKLTDEDYKKPLSSEKLTKGGWDIVQFHPSYGYEDFIRGIEVTIPKGTGTPHYESVNRILGKIAAFSKAAEKAAAGKKGFQNPPKFYLIIDEINRANLATVFGELIYGLEYRDSKVSTPYEVEEDKNTEARTKDIVLGKNLFIIGTMNTADKSIDAIDYAIRRRFIFIDSPADRNVVVERYREVSGNTDENSIELLLFDAVQEIFNGDRFFNTEYQKNDVRIGHTYFLRDRKKGCKETMIERFVFQVVPILREYVKDGILDVTEDLKSNEHSSSDIYSAAANGEHISLLSENIMLYVKEFGNPLGSAKTIIDNAYIGNFIENLYNEFKFSE